MAERSQSDSSGLVRGLGLWASTAVVVGAILGRSVFLVASDMARDAGSPARVLLLWIVGGLIVLCGAICYAELDAMLPQTGGDYIYLSRGNSPGLRFPVWLD
jgi:amino acid transporter